jgi:hypothetical protein
MSLVEAFANQLPESLLKLSEDEWSVTRLRDQVVEEATPQIAFESIVEILLLASKQADPYAFASCCWLANDLAGLSDTTEEPNGIREALAEALSNSIKLNASYELSALLRWYRLPPSSSIELTCPDQPGAASYLKRRVPQSQELRFALNVEDGWPPVATESVWCRVEDEIFELQNAPFFIQGLACGDKFRAVADSVNGCIFDFKLVESSGHSLAWVLQGEGADFASHKAKLKELGCRVEGFPACELWSIDVPATAAGADVDSLLTEIESQGFAVAVPVWRHEASY